MKNFDELDNDSFSESDLKKMLSEMGLDLDFMEQSFESYEPKKTIEYEVTSELSVNPSYNYPSDSGFDLHSIENVRVPSLGRALVPTGIKFDIPDGYEIQIRPKSGLSLKHGITVLNTPGTIDSGYNGEIKVILFNTSDTEFLVEVGMKIAQAVICPVLNGKWVDLQKVTSIENKDRGSNGFGSTGYFKK
jgi:dUTP pyrophosphatase